VTDSEDWRLKGPRKKYLEGASLRYKHYEKWDENWDHDHCAFCWAKFMEEQNLNAPPNSLHEGYATVASEQHRDDYYWICSTCFNDLNEHFKWKLVPTET